MASGHLDEEPAPARATRALLDAHPDLAAFLASDPVISREFKVPYLGGISADGKTVYIDRDLPKVLPDTGIEPDHFIALHERAEWWIMTRLNRDYLGDMDIGGHPFAVRIEHNALIEDDHDPDAYEDELAEYAHEDERAEVQPDDLPPDLFLGPYEDDQDALDRKLLPFLKAAQVPRTGERLEHEVVSYGPGHDPEFCRTCEYSDHALQPMCRYVKSISPDGWCVLWDEAR